MVTVLICTYKREKLLDRCLASLIEGSVRLPDEIVVVDGSGGKAEDVISKWRRKCISIKSIPVKNVNLAASRNVGLSFCTGDIIALADDDVVVNSDWIEKIKKLHKEHPEAGAIGGKVRSADKRFIDEVAESVIFPLPDRSCYIRTIPGANISYKKEVIKKIGEFDETLFRGEDVDYNWRILKTGYKIYYDPALLVYHSNRPRWKDLFMQIFMYGRAYYFVREKWPDMYCVYPHRLRYYRDFLKIIYFFTAIFIEPVIFITKERSITGKIKLYSLLVICQFWWRIGILLEIARSKITMLKDKI